MKTTGWISTGRRVELSDQLLWSLKVALTWRLTYLEVVIWNMKRAMRRVFASASNLVVTWFWDVLPWFDMICRQLIAFEGQLHDFFKSCMVLCYPPNQKTSTSTNACHAPGLRFELGWLGSSRPCELDRATLGSCKGRSGRNAQKAANSRGHLLKQSSCWNRCGKS